MTLTVETIKTEIQRFLVVLRLFYKHTKTKLDDYAVEVLEAIESSDELLELVEKYFGGDPDPVPVDSSDDTKIVWNRIEPFLPTLKGILTEAENPNEETVA